jgi:hypothetical protein
VVSCSFRTLPLRQIKQFEPTTGLLNTDYCNTIPAGFRLRADERGMKEKE